jgi:hypothetical protein
MLFKLNVGKLLASLGTPSQIKARCEAVGLEPPTVKGIQKWREKNSISSQWLTMLVMLPTYETGPKKGTPMDIRNFIEREQEANA